MLSELVNIGFYKLAVFELRLGRNPFVLISFKFVKPLPFFIQCI